MYWMIVFTDDYGEHVNIDVSEEYARAVYARLAADDAVYSVELFHAECVAGNYK